jgi:hypothetical protein
MMKKNSINLNVTLIVNIMKYMYVIDCVENYLINKSC